MMARLHFYRLLPSGNARQFPLIEAQLRRRGVESAYKDFGGARLYRVAFSDFHKLPADPETGEKYLPVEDDHGHSLYLEDRSEFWNVPSVEWVAIKGTD